MAACLLSAVLAWPLVASADNGAQVQDARVKALAASALELAESLPDIEVLSGLLKFAAWVDGFSLPWRERPKVEPVTPPVAPEPEPEPEPAPPPVVYYNRVLLVGECNIEGGLGPILEQQLEAVPGVVVRRTGKRSTGLARLDYYDWPARISELKDEFQPDLIIAYWGDNDCQNCIAPNGERAAAWGDSAAWHAEYTQRTADAVRLMQEGGAAAVIIGMPNMRPEKFRKGISRVNSALAEGCALSGGVFIDAWQFNTGAGGEYLHQVELNGKTRTFQGDDGIHFTSHGAKFMAARIYGEITARFELGDPPVVVADADGAESSAGEDEAGVEENT